MVEKICLPSVAFLSAEDLPDCWACARVGIPSSANARAVKSATGKEVRAIWLFSLYRDCGYLDPRIVYECSDLHGSTSRLRIGHR